MKQIIASKYFLWFYSFDSVNNNILEPKFTCWDNITKNVHSIIFWPFGLYGRYEGLKTYKQVLNWISVQEITIPNIKMYIGWY